MRSVCSIASPNTGLLLESPVCSSMCVVGIANQCKIAKYVVRISFHFDTKVNKLSSRRGLRNSSSYCTETALVKGMEGSAFRKHHTSYSTWAWARHQLQTWPHDDLPLIPLGNSQWYLCISVLFGAFVLQLEAVHTHGSPLRSMPATHPA